MKITNPITLDVARSNSYICLLGKQFDSNSRYLQVTLTNNGQPLPIPSGAGVVLRATRADGAGSMTAGSVNGDGTALVEIDEAVLEVAGAASLSIEVTSGGQVLTSASCNLTVQKADASGWVKVYVAAASVSAGTYHISLAGQSYSFTTTQAIPAGGAIYFNSDGGTAQTRDASGNVLDASLTLTAGTSGTELTSDVPTMTFLAALAQQVGELADTDNAVAGSAEALLGGGTAENVAVALRGNAGNAREKIGKLIGGTIAWNQLVPYGDFSSSSGWSSWYYGGTVSIADNTGTVTGSGNIDISHALGVTIPAGHKALFVATVKGSASGNGTFVYTNAQFPITTSFAPVAGIAALTGSISRAYVARQGSGSFTMNVKNVQVLDLTVTLGPTIADYVYTLESGTAGAGVAWLARYFPKILGGYYAYTAPALLSVNVEGKKISGFNLWDEEWEQGGYSTTTGEKTAISATIRTKNPIKVIPNSTYYFRTPATIRLFWYDSGDNFISPSATVTNGTATAPANAQYLCFHYGAYSYANDITVNLSNPLLNGQYFPHREFYYPIQSGELRGVPKLDANNNLTFDGDWQEPDGTKTRRVKEINVTQFTGAWGATTNGYGVYLTVSDKDQSAAKRGSVISNRFTASGEAYTNMPLYSVGGASGAGTTVSFILPSSITSLAEANTWLTNNPTTLIYLLATPTTEAGQPFLAVERLDNGIEEVVDAGVEAGTRDVVVPVGQDATIYRDLAALLGAIPNPPTSAGTYTLRATVTTTNATFSWS